jgi:catechol 2,3-dioxygenase-like lactoylglutathione lyase family enzyme
MAPYILEAMPAKSKVTVKLDHLSLPVRRLAAARRFYPAALAPTGMKVTHEVDKPRTSFAMGSGGERIFWLVQHRNAAGGAHLALSVPTRAAVDAFHAAALAAGATDHGAPGPRPDYGPNYYAAFVLDGEGNNIEVVCYARGRAAASTRRKRAPAR